ncbi:hypothetical protein C1T31_04700 [Hanstruepera neustonica]|uniref:Peptidase S74 domain-containing protein n=2 Tax=Hanstruepera neustonica TaxID=1445657 RepID=A0A2K1E063_9FLAO|nr:hypothetical protein C1T31_04700 [Hanstruepera neustonica]
MLFGFSQTDGISYQAVIIDNNPQEIPGVDVPSNNLPNTPLQVQFSIIDNNGSVEYQETHSTTTDAYGMIHLMIGHGQSSINAFNQIYWNNEKFLKVEIDLNDGNGWIEFSYQELTYIPYVKHREIIATSTLDVDGETNLNNNFNVNNASPSHLTGDLTVDGNTNLNGTLTVFNQEPTLLTGDLTVEGLVSFDGELAVGGDTNLYSDLTVEGNTLLNGDLTVIGQANFNDGNFQNITVAQNSNLNLLDVSGVSNLNNTLNVSGTSNLNSALNVLGISTLSNTLSVNASSNLNGRVIINANVDGSQNSPSSYPLEVKGSNQGIWIDVDGGRNSNKNFITFSDALGQHGAVEGQTLNELNNSFRYIWDAANALAEEAFIAAEGVACGIQLDAAEATLMGIQTVAAYARLIELVVYAESNVGVSFKTGGADYAEWLLKMNVNEQFYPGEVVGVFGGMISKNTVEANHIMVVSTNPIILGNSTQKMNENLYEKVAFMGQVPVRVIGEVQVGDYILPSGNNDGTAIAKPISEMQGDDYKNIVGVAWESSETGAMASMINVAIGINTNDLSAKVAEHDREIEGLKAQIRIILNQINTEKNSDITVTEDETVKNNGDEKDQKEPSLASKLVNQRPKVNVEKLDFDQWLKDYGYIFEERMKPLREHFEEAGVDLSNFPEIQKLIENPSEVLRDMQDGSYLPSIWESLKKRYPNAFKE